MPFDVSSTSRDKIIASGVDDAESLVASVSNTLAALKKAGVDSTELKRFEEEVITALAHVTDLPSKTADGNGVIAEGSLDKLQQGAHGFSSVWKTCWIRLVPGEMQVFESSTRPEPDALQQLSLRLSLQQTTVNTGSEALCRKLGRDSIVMVGSTAALGDCFRCITLASKDDFGLQQWVVNVEKAISEDSSHNGASIFRASKAGDILRVKELISRGVDVNGTNSYGCAPLHYAAKNAADLAMLVARGSDETTDDHCKIRAQEAVRVVYFLMSHGADARAVNDMGETPLDIACRLTSDFPKTTSLFRSILSPRQGDSQHEIPSIFPGGPSKRRMQSEQDQFNANVLHPPRDVVPRGLRHAPPRRRNSADRGKNDAVKPLSPGLGATPALFLLRGVSRSPQTLPARDHKEVAMGASHALFIACGPCRGLGDVSAVERPMNARIVPRMGARNKVHGSTKYKRSTGLMFKNLRMGRSSAVLERIPKDRKLNPRSGARPGTCPAQANSSHNWTDGNSRPTKVNRGNKRLRVVKVRRDQYLHRSGVLSDRNVRSPTPSRPYGDGVPSLPNSEVERQISKWLQERTCGRPTVPPPAAHAAGGHLSETSSFVDRGNRFDVYQALHAMKGKSLGELISNDKLRRILCRTGQPLLPSEMDALLREADPTSTGYVSCSRLSTIVTSNRLAPLATGETHNKDDDVVLKAKARRLARLRLDVAPVQPP